MSDQIVSKKPRSGALMIGAAALAGTALTVGTYALWSDSAQVAGGTVSSANLDIALGESTRFEEQVGSKVNISEDPAWTPVGMEDQARALTTQVWLTDLDAINTGDNMQGRLSVDVATGGMDEAAAQGFTWKLIERTPHDPAEINAALLSEPVAQGTVNDGEDTDPFMAAKGETEYTLVLTGALPSTINGQPVHSEGFTVDVADFDFTLNQVREG